MKKILIPIFMILLMNNALGALQLDSIQYDPAIIAAGDEVDIIVQYHDETLLTDDNKLGNPNYSFVVELQADDTLTEEYITIQDAKGNDLNGAVFAGAYYNKLFRIKVNNNAPAGNYEFKLVGTWYYKGTPMQGYEYVRFKMPVKKEGIIIQATNIITNPLEVRPGDDYVQISLNLENIGEKSAKIVGTQLVTPNLISASYSNNNRVFAGRIDSGSSKLVDYFVDVNDNLKPGVYTLKAMIDYVDLDDNSNSKVIEIPFLVKARPNLVIVNSYGESLTSSSGKLFVEVLNNGSESAQAVDVRILKQNSQPFIIDVRSDYLGELEPGETQTAIFDIKVNGGAAIKDYDLQLLIRSQGDSDTGDDNIYTYNRRAKFSVTGNPINWLLIIGIAALIVVLIIWVKKK